MNSFKDIFNNWVEKKTKKQIEIIDEICLETGIDPGDWFEYFLENDIDNFSEDELLTEILNSFVCYLDSKFDEPFIEFLPDSMIKKNIFGGSYVDFYIELALKKSKTKGYKFVSNNKKDIKRIRKFISISDREKIMKNKLVFYIINQTKMKIYSKNEIRYLKIKQLNNISG